MVKDFPIEITDFIGLNLENPASAIDTGELSECINLMVTEKRKLRSRPGYSLAHVTDQTENYRFVGEVRTDNVEAIVLTEDTTPSVVYYTPEVDPLAPTVLEYTDADIGALAGRTINKALQYVNNKVYLLTDTTLLSFDDTDLTLVVDNVAEGGRDAIVFKDRLFIAEAAGNDSYLIYSDINDFTTFGASSFIQVSPGDGDTINALYVLNDTIMIFKDNSIWGLYADGAPANWVLRKVESDLGCKSNTAITLWEDNLYFLDYKGVYASDGVNSTRISTPIDEFFNEREGFSDTSTVIVNNNVLYAHVNDSPSTFKLYALNFKSGGWTEWQLTDSQVDIYASNSVLNSHGMYFVDSEGSIYYVDRVYTSDNGSPVQTTFTTKSYDLDQPTVMKRGKWLGVESSGAVIYTVTHYTEEELKVVLTGVSASTRQIQKLKGPEYFRTWKFQFNSDMFVDFTFYGLTLYVASKSHVVSSST